MQRLNFGGCRCHCNNALKSEKTPRSVEITAFLVRLPGLEPGASGLGGSRSIQLSYRRIL